MQKRGKYVLYGFLGVIFLAFLGFLALVWQQYTMLKTLPVGTALSDGSPEIASYQPILGNETSSIAVHVYYDFNCPYCARSHEIEQKMLAEYGDRVKFVYKNFPVIRDTSAFWAEAGLCAHEQGKYEVFADFAFNNIQNVTFKDIASYAQGLGLDKQAFLTCFNNGKYTDAVQADLQEAFDLGLRGTPAFVIYGQVFPGFLSEDQFRQLIEAAL
jgi:protein-disulfide isomerase